MHNLKTKSSCIILKTPWLFYVNFCISTKLILVTEVACGNNWIIYDVFWPIFGRLFANFATIEKNFFQKSKCTHHLRTKRHLCAKFDF